MNFDVTIYKNKHTTIADWIRYLPI